MTTDFKWDPYSDQIYTSADGGPDETVTGSMEGGDYFDKYSSSFTMDAKGHKLTLVPRKDIVGPYTDIEWPIMDRVPEAPTQITIRNGTLTIDARPQPRIGFRFGYHPIEVLVENTGELNLLMDDQIFMGSEGSIILKDDARFALRTPNTNAYVNLDGKIRLSDRARAELRFPVYGSWVGPNTLDLLVEDKAQLSLYGRVVPREADEPQEAYSLGIGTPRIDFFRYDDNSPYPFDFVSNEYRKGIFNCVSPGNSGVFRFIDLPGNLQPPLAIIDKQLVAINGVPQEDTTRYQVYWEETSTRNLVIAFA